MAATDIFRLLGDALSIVTLSILWSFTLTTWKRVPDDVLVPMQITGSKASRVGKRFGLLFMPILATILLLTPTLTGVIHEAASTDSALIVFCLRVMLASAFGLIGMAHLRKVIVTLAAEGALKDSDLR